MQTGNMTTSTNGGTAPAMRPLLLLPGYWLGAWIWGPIVESLTGRGVRAQAVTLPGLESSQARRDQVHFADHVDFVVANLEAFGEPAVLAAHSGSGAVATAVSDRVPELLAKIVYVDSGPCTDGTIPVPDLPAEVTELPFPGVDALPAPGASVEGISDQDKARFEALAVPHPAGACREPVELHDPRRNAIPTTLVCCSIRSEQVRELAAAGEPTFAAVNDLTDLTFIDLPTGHWPMFSRPDDLAELLYREAADA